MKVGDSLFLVCNEVQVVPHCHALYLGKDNTNKEKVLLPTFVDDGFAVVDLDKIPKYSYRPAGKFNIAFEKITEEGPVYYDYLIYDIVPSSTEAIERHIHVSRENGEWTIVKKELPLWKK
jgi:hypothetical protein